MKNSLQLFLVVLMLLLSVVVGCQQGPKIVPVSGIVTLDGKPLDTGMVTVYVQNSRPAYGKISQGKFTLMTKEPGDGCAVGEHPITVSSRKSMGSEAMRHFIPEKYSDEVASGLKIKIDGPTDNLEIKLTWEGSGHKEPYVTGDTSKKNVKEK